MKRIVFTLLPSLVLAGGLLSMSGCNRGSGNAGTYISDKDPQSFTELKRDGSFTVKQGNIIVSGKFIVDGKKISYTIDNGPSFIASIEGNIITDDEGIHWKKL